MSDTVIKIENLWKEYRYGAVSHRYLFKDVQSWWARVCGREDPNAKIEAPGMGGSPMRDPGNDRFWALRDISAEIRQGEVLGIIGRNGAGKSTLLKILSRVTAPTRGSVKIKGRIGSLLEVGTGFHPELTGRENIFLNGAILGMRKAEITAKFDQIVAFAEVERFIDTPVKRYSSGMYVRLAFAVAAHLDPEILVVDEVLAVGDVEFQKKCLGKMGAISQEGRTVLFVSHNMESIRKLCKSCMHLQAGKVIEYGDCEPIVQSYVGNRGEASTGGAFDLLPAEKPPEGYCCEACIEDTSSRPASVLLVGQEWQLRVRFRISKPLDHFIVGLGVSSRMQGSLWTTWTTPRSIAIGDYTIVFQQDQIFFSGGRYYVNIGLSCFERPFFYREEALPIDISPVSIKNDIVRTQGIGCIVNHLRYRIERNDS